MSPAVQYVYVNLVVNRSQYDVAESVFTRTPFL
jgi:hypothetical protein